MTFPLDPIRKISRLRGVLGLCLLAGLVSGLLLRVQAQSAWTSVDINTTFPGATTEDGSSIAVQASGAGIAGDSDSFRFVYQAAAGDFEFSAKITEWQASTYRSRAGLMIRNSANPAAAYVAVMIQDNTGYRLQWRTNDGGSSSSNNLSAAVSLPVWLKLSKQGNTVSAFYSQDGQAWTSLFTPKTVSFDPDFPYGLAVTSSREGVYVQAGFTEITIPGAPLATATATSTLTPTATATDTPTATNMPTASDTHTPAPASTSTPTATATNTPIPTATHTPTATATDTPAASPTYTPTPTPTPAQPVISRFDPQEGPAGAYVRIFGSDLQQVTEVRFNGVLASFSHHPNLYLVAIVPEGTTTGPITVAGPGGSDASDTPFTVTYPPSISGYSPQEGPVGTLVTIQGEHFSGTREVVFTNDVPAEFVVVSDVEIQAVVPQGATSGPIYIISPNGSALTGTFTVIPPAEWTSLDINTRSPGSTLQNGSSLTVRGSGAGLWGSSDSFRFVYQPASADLEFSARISQWNYTTSRSKGGLIMRSSVDPGAAYVSVMLSSGSGYRLQWRTSDGAGSSANILSAPINLPVWLKLSKQGNTITAFYSPDGQAWTRISAPKTINLPPDYLYGMAVTASREGYYAQATFEEFQPPIGQPPLVSSFEPMTAHFSPAAAEIDIWGSAFSGATSVTFNGVPALSFSVVSDAHIRATVPSEGPLHGPLFVTTPFGSDISSQSFTYIWDHLFPAIASFSPTAGLPGATVTITGRNFTGATQVSFNGGLSHDFTVISDTTIQSVLPDLARSGRIYVTNPAGQGKSSGGFTVYTSDSPTRIDSFLPASAQAGETVAIYGSSFFSSAAAQVSFGGRLAAFTTVSDNEIKATIPYDSVPDGPICVLTPAGAAASLEAFTYLPSPPRIKYVLPQSGPAGSAVQIVGDHLDSVYRVTFNGIPAGKIIHYGFTGLWAVVPPGAGAGPLQVTNPAGTVSWIEPFTITERLWDSVDIGTLYSGLDFMDGSSLTVRGSGSGVSGASDSFRYVYTPASGDLDLWSQVIAWDGRSSPAAFGGLMVRKSTAPDAAYLAIYLTGSGEIRREWRSVDGGPVSSAATSSSFSLPVWLRLRKSGNKLSAYYTYDPRLVFIDEQVEIEFNNDYLYGMAVAAGKDGSYAQATFDIITNGGSPSGLFGMIGTTGSTALYSSCPGP